MKNRRKGDLRNARGESFADLLAAIFVYFCIRAAISASALLISAECALGLSKKREKIPTFKMPKKYQILLTMAAIYAIIQAS